MMHALEDLATEVSNVYKKHIPPLIKTIQHTVLTDGRSSALTSEPRYGEAVHIDTLPHPVKKPREFRIVARQLAMSLSDAATTYLIDAFHESLQEIDLEYGYSFDSGIEMLSKARSRTPTRVGQEWYGLLSCRQWSRLLGHAEFGLLSPLTSNHVPRGIEGRKWHNTIWMPHLDLPLNHIEPYGFHYKKSALQHVVQGPAQLSIKPDDSGYSIIPSINQRVDLLDSACVTRINVRESK